MIVFYEIKNISEKIENDPNDALHEKIDFCDIYFKDKMTHLYEIGTVRNIALLLLGYKYQMNTFCHLRPNDLEIFHEIYYNPIIFFFGLFTIEVYQTNFLKIYERVYDILYIFKKLKNIKDIKNIVQEDKLFPIIKKQIQNYKENKITLNYNNILLDQNEDSLISVQLISKIKNEFNIIKQQRKHFECFYNFFFIKKNCWPKKYNNNIFDQLNIFMKLLNESKKKRIAENKMYEDERIKTIVINLSISIEMFFCVLILRYVRSNIMLNIFEICEINLIKYLNINTTKNETSLKVKEIEDTLNFCSHTIDFFYILMKNILDNDVNSSES